MTGRAFLLPALVLGLFLAAPLPAGSRKEIPGWKISQLTSCREGSIEQIKVTEDGDKIFFLSSCDFESGNSDRSLEIFELEVKSGNIRQVTDQSYCNFFEFDVAPGGGRLAAVSNCYFNGLNRGNGLELVTIDAAGKNTVLTQSMGMRTGNPSFSSDGKWIVFESYADLEPGKNPDLSREIFIVDLSQDPPGVRQLSSQKRPAECKDPAMASDIIVALCNGDFPVPEGERAIDRGGITVLPVGDTPPGMNPDLNFELVRLDLAGNLKPLTNTADCKIDTFALDRRGRRIALFTGCGLGGGKNEAGSGLYILDGRTRRVLPGLRFQGLTPVWSDDANRLFFSSQYFTEDMNRDRNQDIWVLDITAAGRGAGPDAVTDFSQGISLSPLAGRDGRVFFLSSANLDSRNIDGGLEIFSATEPMLDPDEWEEDE